MKRVMFTIPPKLLEQVEKAAVKLNTSRSGLIRQALEHFLEEQRRQELQELLKEGYLYRAEESLQLAEEFHIAEQEAWDKYTSWEEG
jgi:CopG family transcriptional regulator/antitoxin EndoAI